MTNREKLGQKTNEEIADFLAQLVRCEENDCPAYDFCTDYSAQGYMTKAQYCARALSEWLEQEG